MGHDDAELSEEDVKALVDALLVECCDMQTVENDPPPPASSSFERRPSWMSQLGKSRSTP